jgi:NTP pyrophosphatase (non-canonical NTP hydrolase)
MALTFREVREANQTRQESIWPACRDIELTYWTTALAGETGEACEIIKKASRDVGRLEARDEPTDILSGNDVTALSKELADIVHYCDILACRCGIDLGKAVQDKFNEVSERLGVEHRL